MNYTSNPSPKEESKYLTQINTKTLSKPIVFEEGPH